MNAPQLPPGLARIATTFTSLNQAGAGVGRNHEGEQITATVEVTGNVAAGDFEVRYCATAAEHQDPVHQEHLILRVHDGQVRGSYTSSSTPGEASVTVQAQDNSIICDVSVAGDSMPAGFTYHITISPVLEGLRYAHHWTAGDQAISEKSYVVFRTTL